MRTRAAILAIVVLWTGLLACGAEVPDLPAGLDGPDEASVDLPEGLADDEPDLPAGIDEPARPDEQPADAGTFADAFKEAGFAGFIEVRGGVRTQNDPHEKLPSIGEARLQLEWLRDVKSVRLKFTGDLLYDQVDNSLSDVDLRRGRGFFDLREAWAGFSPLPWMDVKLGRQILTWGTGDLLFVNDLFPKDWQAFFTGRDLEYLKAPSDAVKVSAFSRLVDLDFVYIPLMNPSRFISGRRLSYFNPTLGRLAGSDAIIRDDLPSEWFRDDEYAVRLSRKIGSYELAAYGFRGFFKTPEGFDPVRNRAFYPRLDSYGASIRGPLWRGIANLEAAYYDSVDDRSGNDPLIANSQVRLLAGYEMDLPEIAKELTVGAQYYVEIMQDHDAYMRTLPPTLEPADETRQVITLRLTKQLLNQDLTLGLFTYYSPTDNDAYLRPKATYKIDDHWTVELGGNVFVGRRSDTFFGQLRRNSNIYAAFRYSF